MQLIVRNIHDTATAVAAAAASPAAARGLGILWRPVHVRQHIDADGNLPVSDRDCYHTNEWPHWVVHGQSVSVLH